MGGIRTECPGCGNLFDKLPKVCPRCGNEKRGLYDDLHIRDKAERPAQSRKL